MEGFRLLYMSNLEKHLDSEYDGEDVVEYVEYPPLVGPGRDVGPLMARVMQLAAMNINTMKSK